MFRLRPRKRTVIFLIILAAVIPLLVGSYILWWWANSPVTETETTVAASAAVAGVPDQIVTSACFSFEAPGDFRVKDVTDPKYPNFIHTQVFEASSNGRQAGITCNTLPAAGLQDVADYSMRVKLTDRYEPYTTTDLPPGSEAFRDPETGEVTVFMVNGKRYAVIAVTGIMNNDRLQNFASQIYTTWKWL